MADDCTTCGACCFSESPRHARVTGDDHERLGDDADRLVVFLGNQAYMRLARDAEDAPNHCAALVIEGGRFLCAVYERRPQVCRDLERGSPACEGELATKGDRPRRSLVTLATRRP